MTPDTADLTATERRQWCHDALNGTSRTFAITVELLNEPMKTQICVSYLLCRVADTVEDAGHIPSAEQARLLTTYNRVLDPDDEAGIETFREMVEPWLPNESTDDWRVVAHAPRIVRTFERFDADAREAIRGPVRELVSGMAMFVERHADTDGIRIETIAELEEYCWYAAGTVGTLITNLLARNTSPRRAHRLRENDRAFALLLQLVNVAKDVSMDYHEENNVYLPATWLREHGVEPEGVCEPENTTAVAAVIRRVATHATGYADDAWAYLEATPETGGNTLAAWAVPYLLAVGTLRELDDRAEDVLHDGGVKLSRPEVLSIVEQFSHDADRSSLETLRRRVANGPYHRNTPDETS